MYVRFSFFLARWDGVKPFSLFFFFPAIREPRLLGNATRAISERRLNGAVVPTAHARYAMLVVYVSVLPPISFAPIDSLGSLHLCRLREAGAQTRQEPRPGRAAGRDRPGDAARVDARGEREGEGEARAAAEGERGQRQWHATAAPAPAPAERPDKDAGPGAGAACVAEPLRDEGADPAVAADAAAVPCADDDGGGDGVPVPRDSGCAGGPGARWFAPSGGERHGGVAACHAEP